MQNQQSAGKLKILLLLKRHWLSAVLFVLFLYLYITGFDFLPLSESNKEIYKHLMLTLTAVMGIHLLDRLFLAADTINILKRLEGNLSENITSQTDSLVNLSKSLQTMSSSGIVQIYKSRSEAAADMLIDLSNPNNSELRIIGISLNDFVQGTEPILKKAWEGIEKLVIDPNSKSELSIKVLLIDPNCFGAKLRSESESENMNAVSLRLKSDVDAAAKYFFKLANITQKISNDEKKSGVTFECRLYSLPPILFLCWTDTSCYVQQYHFWSKRDNATPTPVLKFRNLGSSRDYYPYHEEMEHHFEWIWKNASLKLDDYISGEIIGTDCGINQCAFVNVYTDRIKAHDRLLYLLKEALRKIKTNSQVSDKNQVSIQGVSLTSFFESGKLRQAISDLLENDVEIEVLLLDKDSHQAQVRSYREYRFGSKTLGFHQYLEEKKHLESALYKDTTDTIVNIKNMVNHIRERKEDESWEPKLKVWTYDSAPACFVLHVNDSVFVEQYHYGKIIPIETPAILGKDMPLIEYKKNPSKLYQGESDPLRLPYGLFLNHIEYVKRISKEVDLTL